MRTIFEITGILQKEDFSEITEEENEKLADAFLEFVVDNGYLFAGGFSHLTEDEYGKQLF